VKPGRIELHVEELMLHGFEPADRHRIGLAVEHELGRLFAERGAPRSLTRGEGVPRLNAGSFQVTPGARAESIGARVAQAVYRGMGA
jgi:hypothetical protein